MIAFKDKNAVVTGAGRGIGRGIAHVFAKAGANVIVADLDLHAAESVAKEAAAFGVRSLAVACDVSKKAEVEALFRQAVGAFGTVHILVNNAGIFPFVPFAEMQESDWDTVMDVNAKSVFLCSQEAAKTMPEGGRIVSISSIASFVGFAELAHYCASKGAVNSMTRVLALELAPRKITVNAVAPGAIDTPGASKGSTEEERKQTIAIIPLARMGEPEDIGHAVAFLASDAASYITGQTIIVDGGWTLR